MPVQVFASSPINASKASGVTPQTARPEDAEARAEAPPTTTLPVEQPAYPPAQPGARPSLPVQPTPTQAGPPPPQLGAVPSPYGRSHVPPPPEAGEPAQQPPQITAMPMPPQMSYPPPIPTYPAQGGSSTATATFSAAGPKPTFLQGDGAQADFSHPPGYHQNINATDFSSSQRAAHNASLAQGVYLGAEEEGVWGTAKKWAAAAGDSLAAAENEVWKKINKD